MEHRSPRRPEPPVGRSRTRRRRAHLLPLLPRRRVAVFFLLADKPRRPPSLTHALRPVATEVRTSFSRPSKDAPTFEPRGNAPFAPFRCRW
jgi:hypothetical protein